MATESINSIAAAEQAKGFKERFEFILTVNDNIACQRYFKINNFNDRVYSTQNFKNSFDYVTDLIQKELESKTRIYLALTSPRCFTTKKQMDEWFKEHETEVKLGEVFIYKEGENVVAFTYDGKVLKSSPSFGSDRQYLFSSEGDEVTIKFAFLDNGREMMSSSWDGSNYPRLVRNNVDLSNKKVPFPNTPEGSKSVDYVTEEDLSRLPFESSAIYHMIVGKSDLAYKIIKEFQNVSNGFNDNPTETTVKYGDKEYELDVRRSWNEYVSKLEKKYKKKTISGLDD